MKHIGHQKRLATILSIEPDCVILPTQWWSTRKPDLSPEKKLCCAVLEDALTRLDHERKAPDSPWVSYLAQEAKDWIASEVASVPFAFRWICEWLELDADYMRRGIADYLSRPGRIPHPHQGAHQSMRVSAPPPRKTGRHPLHHTAHTTLGILRGKTDPRGTAYAIRNRGGGV